MRQRIIHQSSCATMTSPHVDAKCTCTPATIKVLDYGESDPPAGPMMTCPQWLELAQKIGLNVLPAEGGGILLQHDPKCASVVGADGVQSCDCWLSWIANDPGDFPNMPFAKLTSFRAQPGTLGFTQEGENLKLGHAPGCAAALTAANECTCGFGALMKFAREQMGQEPLAAIFGLDAEGEPAKPADLGDGPAIEPPAFKPAPSKPKDELPDGDYAICEFMGHRTIVGRVTEVERFGAKYIGVEPLYKGQLLPMLLMGGASVYAFTPCSKAQALLRSPKQLYQLPDSLAAAVPDLLKELLPPIAGEHTIQTFDLRPAPHDPDFNEVEEPGF